jgi:diguanylate cyclase (GGDEF)-like protein
VSWVRGALDRLVAHRFGAGSLVFSGTFVAYVGLGWCGYELIGASAGITSFWPATGLIVGLLVVLPARLRPWAAAALLPGELVTDIVLQGYPASTAFGWGINNILEASLAAWILLRVAHKRPRGDTLRDVVAVAAAAIAAPLVGGLGGGAVAVATWGGPFLSAWLNWWRGDATGLMLVVPLVMAMAARQYRRSATKWLTELAEVGLFLGTVVAVFVATSDPLEFLVLPPLALIAVRRGLRFTAMASLCFASIATICTGRGLGPFSVISIDPSVQVLGLQTFIATIAFGALLIAATISERTRAVEALAKLATEDPLTGVANRRRFIERLDETTTRQGRSSAEAAVAYFDLDAFKSVNDQFGHAAGDAVLVEVARRLSEAARSTDLVARIGGDEFAVLLEPVNGSDGASLSAQRLATAVGRPFAYEGQRIRLATSVGSALIGSDSDSSLAEADHRLYRDKARHRTALPAV